jgi:Glycosyl hydrolase family 99
MNLSFAICHHFVVYPKHIRTSRSPKFPSPRPSPLQKGRGWPVGRVRGTLLLLAILSLCGFPSSPAVAASKPIMVYYMPWYVAKPHSSNWGWHWTMDHFDPDIINAAGERQIASWYYPLIGPYDSADPVVLEYHVLLMKLAGIEGVIVDWYGRDDYLDYGGNNERTTALFDWTRKAGLKFSLCYEDQTIRQEINGGFISASNALGHAQQALLYAQTNFFTDPSYLQWNRRPVLLNFGPQYFQTNSQWEAIFSVLNATNHPAFFTEDNRFPVGVGAFNWPPMWLSQAPGTRGVLSVAALEGYLTAFDQKAAAWPAFISSAWPRFHDIYQPAGVRDYWGYLGDRAGETFRATLARALTNSSAIVQIVTWNDFGEGTVVEPTREYGYRDLGIIQDFRRQYLEPKFPNDTNDLALATRLYHLRRQSWTNSSLAAELDRVFTNIVTGDLPAALRALNRLESKSP